jgi:hypothetical protein
MAGRPERVRWRGVWKRRRRQPERGSVTGQAPQGFSAALHASSVTSLENLKCVGRRVWPAGRSAVLAR